LGGETNNEIYANSPLSRSTIAKRRHTKTPNKKKKKKKNSVRWDSPRATRNDHSNVDTRVREGRVKIAVVGRGLAKDEGGKKEYSLVGLCCCRVDKAGIEEQSS